MNKFRELGLIDYNGHIEVHSSLLNVVLHDQPQFKRSCCPLLPRHAQEESKYLCRSTKPQALALRYARKSARRATPQSDLRLDQSVLGPSADAFGVRTDKITKLDGTPPICRHRLRRRGSLERVRSGGLAECLGDARREGLRVREHDLLGQRCEFLGLLGQRLELLA